jgi:putative ABC transport system substrate-binding protein
MIHPRINLGIGYMRRREFITLLGGATAAQPMLWPQAARAQQPAMPLVGYLHSGLAEANADYVAAFRKGLSEGGYLESRNVAIEFRWAQNDLARLPELATDLVRRRVSVIATPASVASALAAKGATTAIPIVFSTGADPVQAGLVASLNRPGSNVTGFTTMGVELLAKRLGLLHELLPGAARFGVFVNPISPVLASIVADLQTASSKIGRQIELVTAASTNRDIDAAFASLGPKRIDGLLVEPNQFFTGRRVQFATLAVRYAVPVLYPLRDFVEAGGLMSYGASLIDMNRQVGVYTGRILNGEKPANLPVIQANKFEFILNLQTARTIGLTIPTGLLAIANELIE